MRAAPALLLPALLLLAPALAGCAGPTGERQVGPLVGNLAPPFRLEPVDGNGTFDLAGQRGKVVLLDLMGVNCPPCRAEMPHLKALADAHAEDPAFAMLSVDMASVFPALGARDHAEIRAFRDEFGAGWPFAPDPQGTVGVAYEPIAIPTLVVVDPEGVIARKFSGGVTPVEQLEAAVAKARGGP